MNRYRRVVEYLSAHPWAITREKLDGIVELIRMRSEGGRLAEDEIATRLAAARATQGERRAESFAGIVPIYGVIMPRANLMTEMSGGTTVEGLRRSFRAALADPEISRIIFDVDSPGGSVEGITEIAAEIRDARGQKPMTAVANFTMASAAYWIAAQADEIMASPSALVGSIGVYGVHEDWSVANEQMGVAPTYISAGKYKTEGNPDAPLGDEARAHMQELVDASYDLFVRDVAAGRGVSPSAVKAGYGEGRVLPPEAARAAGLIDGIATYDEVLGSKPPRMKARTKAEDVELIRQATGAAEHIDVAALAADAERFAYEQERRRRLGLRPA
jgi:signal peptide peptidase SppA